MTICTITMKDGRSMVFSLCPEKAPLTTASFADLANSGFYDGLCFCRIVKGYVLQGGSPDNDIMTDSSFHIIGEFAENGYDTGMDHRRGAISMARDEAPDTAGTQFFICHLDAHKLDGRYASFGYMTEGFDVLDRLAALPTTGAETWNKPLNLPIMERVRVTSDTCLPEIRRISSSSSFSSSVARRRRTSTVITRSKGFPQLSQCRCRLLDSSASSSSIPARLRTAPVTVTGSQIG